MKKRLFNFGAILLIAGFSNNVMAQNEASASSDAFATVVAPIGIAHNGTDLEFGTMIKGIGTVTIPTSGPRTFSNSALNPGDQGVAPTPAVFTVTGEGAYTYSIAFTNPTETLTNPGSQTMIAGTFIALSADGEGLTGTLSSGTDTVTVGATLTLDDDETAGIYAGSFEVTVAYN